MPQNLMVRSVEAIPVHEGKPLDVITALYKHSCNLILI